MEKFEHKFDHKPDYAFLTVQIPEGKTLKVEASAMATMDTNINMKSKFKQSLIGTAVVFTVFVGAVNMSPVFAKSIQDVPVLGSLAKVLSVNTYGSTDADKSISVNQPVVNPELVSGELFDFNDINYFISYCFKDKMYFCYFLFSELV